MYFAASITQINGTLQKPQHPVPLYLNPLTQGNQMYYIQHPQPMPVYYGPPITSTQLFTSTIVAPVTHTSPLSYSAVVAKNPKWKLPNGEEIPLHTAMTYSHYLGHLNKNGNQSYEWLVNLIALLHQDSEFDHKQLKEILEVCDKMDRPQINYWTFFVHDSCTAKSAVTSAMAKANVDHLDSFDITVYDVGFYIVIISNRLSSYQAQSSEEEFDLHKSRNRKRSMDQDEKNTRIKRDYRSRQKSCKTTSYGITHEFNTDVQTFERFITELGYASNKVRLLPSFVLHDLIEAWSDGGYLLNLNKVLRLRMSGHPLTLQTPVFPEEAKSRKTLVQAFCCAAARVPQYQYLVSAILKPGKRTDSKTILLKDLLSYNAQSKNLKNFDLPELPPSRDEDGQNNQPKPVLEAPGFIRGTLNKVGHYIGDGIKDSVKPIYDKVCNAVSEATSSGKLLLVGMLLGMAATTIVLMIVGFKYFNQSAAYLTGHTLKYKPQGVEIGTDEYEAQATTWLLVKMELLDFVTPLEAELMISLNDLLITLLLT